MWDKENAIISIESNNILTNSAVEEKRTCNRLSGGSASHLHRPDDEEVDDFNPAQQTDPHAEPHQPANVSQELEPGEPLPPLLLHVVELLEVDVYVGHVVCHVGVVQVLGMPRCNLNILFSSN